MSQTPPTDPPPDLGRRLVLWGLVALISAAWSVRALLPGRLRPSGRGTASVPAQESDPAGPSELARRASSAQAEPAEPAGGAARCGVWTGDLGRRTAIDCLLLALAATAIAVSVLGAGGTAPLLLVLGATCLVPGGALLTRLPADDLLSAFSLAVGLSFCIEATGALVMIWTGWWHPVGFSFAIVALASAMLVLDLRRSLRGSAEGGDHRRRAKAIFSGARVNR
jgi:hypothetical protein